MIRTLIAYYSFEGNTRLLSETMAEKIGADLLEIRPKREMMTKGFMKFIWGGGQVMMNRIPELEDLARDPSDYDLVIVGTPVWSWSPSPPVKAFMRKADLDGSMVALFCTHEGGPGKTLQKMKEDLDGRVVGERGFFAPLKKDREKTLTEAISWAREMVSVSSSREIR